MADLNDRNGMGTTRTSGTGSGTMDRDWSSERQWWQDNYRSRPYATADRSFEQHEAGYRYGTESATRDGGRSWDDAEGELRSGWDRYEHRGDNTSTWDEIKHSVKDAWDRVTGDDRDARHAGTTARRTR